MSSETETSPDVCYRHPQRESWVLCQRCGRTICPECQILAPVGVQCPECVKEAGGSVQWRSAASSARRPKPRSAPRPRSAAWSGSLRQMLRPGSSTPVLSWAIVAVTVLLWLVSLFAGAAAFVWLAAVPGFPLEIWRYATALIVYPPVVSVGVILSLLLNVVFFLFIAPSIERTLGRAKYVVVLLASVTIGNAAMVLSGAVGYGLVTALFGFFGAYLILMWSIPPARTQALVMIGINVLFSIALGGYILPAIVGGVIGGAGATFLLRHYEDRPRSRRATPYLIIGAVVAALILLAILRAAGA